MTTRVPRLLSPPPPLYIYVCHLVQSFLARRWLLHLSQCIREAMDFMKLICPHSPYVRIYLFLLISGILMYSEIFYFVSDYQFRGNKHCVILLLSCLTGVEPQWSFRVFWQSISLTLQDTTYFLNLLHIFFLPRFRVIVLILGAGDLSLVRLLCKSRIQLYTLEILYIVDWLNV